MTTTSSSLSKAQVKGLYQVFNSTNDKIVPYHKEMFNIDTSERGYEEAMQSTALTYVPEKGEGVKAQSQDIKQSFVTRKHHKTYARVFKITKEAFDDNLYKSQIGLQGTADMKLLRDAFDRTKEFEAANVFNNAQSSSLTYGDGKAMIASDHPSEIGADRSNLSSYGTFGEAAVEDAFIKIMRSKSLEGNVAPLNPMKLLLPPERKYEAERIFGSVLRSGTSDNDKNVFQNSVDVVINPYFTFETGFVFLTDYRDDALTMFQRQAKEMRELPMEDDNVYRFMCDERYSFVLFDFLKVFGNVGS